jgi:hypothetical protein
VSHVLVLGAVTGLVVMSALAAGRDAQIASSASIPDVSEPAPAADPTPSTPAWLAQANLDLSAATLDARAALPLWVRTTRETTLWSSSDPSVGVALGSLPISGYLRPLGKLLGGRLQVYFPGDGGRPSAQAWVDVAGLEPSTSGPTLPRVAPPQRVADLDPPNVTALHVAIIDDASGQMIYGDDPDTRVPQASTTKIATTIVALERASDLQQRVNVTVSATAMAAADGSSTMGLEPGERVKLETLLYGMMLPSGNDAAEQVAVSLGGSRATFVEWMNQEAQALGLKNTHFVNPSGMDADGHYSSAYDMAMLARYAMNNPEFRTLASTVHYTSDGYPMKNLNRLLGVYPGADGVKIGETDNAGKTIVASAVHDGHRLYISLMHSADLAGDCAALFDWAWDAFAW